MSRKESFVSIIIVNYKGSELLKNCLDSLFGVDYPKDKFEIIVVDNCPEDDSSKLVRTDYKKVKVIENLENNYCKACNLGIVSASGNFIVLLNNDIRVTQGWLLELVKAIEQDYSIGAVTSKLLNDDGTIQNAGLVEFPNFYWEERGAGREGKELNAITEIDAISGACVLFRRKALDQVGLLDEDFVMFGEDVDISLRLKNKGWKLVFVPSSKAYHRLHGSCNESFARQAIETNRLLLIAKHFPRKLSNALLGSGYFSVNGKTKESGQLFNFIPRLFLKLIKEHSTEVANEAMKETIAELKRIVSFDSKKLAEDLKNILADLNETRKDRDHYKNDKILLGTELSNLRKELTNYKEEITNLANKLRDSLDSGLAKDNTINQLNLEFKRYKEETASTLTNYKEEIANLADKLKDSLDSGLAKDNTINQLNLEFKRYKEETASTLTNYKEEIANLADKLEESLEVRLKLERELSGIYSSEGFKFILKPLWEIVRFSRLISKFLFFKISGLISAAVVLIMTAAIFLQVSLFSLEGLIEVLFGWFARLMTKERKIIPFDALTVSVVIPNWNGVELLKKCLASIYEIDSFSNGDCEVLVVDDASVYDIAEHIKDEFPKTRVIRNKQNQGFGRSCNIGVKQAKGELIVLLNNDIMVSKDFLEPLRVHFKDEDVFAVAPKLYGWDKKTFNYGMHMGRFRNGYLSLWNEAETGNGEKVSKTAATIFAVGGAMVFRKKDFLWLGGFDDIYRPNCWEDIDISYRAQKRGLKVLYEPKSLVFHKGGATVNYIRHKEIKNELLFMWKNISDDRMLLSHLIWLPRFFYRGKHSSPLTFLRGYLWAFSNLIPALVNRFKERAYFKVSDKKILDRYMLYYRNLIRSNYIHERKKTVLLITPFILYPLNCGGKLRIYNLYKRLSQKYNLILLTLIHHKEEEKYIPFLQDIFSKIYAVHTKTSNTEPFFPKRYRYSFSRFLIEKLSQIQESLPIDIVQIESNELLYLAKHIKYIPLVYTEHDISILSLQNSYYHKGLRDTLFDFLDYLKLVSYHSAVYRRIDHVVTLSKEDRRIIKAFSPRTKCSLIPTGVDLGHFKFKEKSGSEKSLIFIGHYPHFPNEEAVVYFCKKILPLIREKIPDVTLKLIGSSPTEEVIRLSKIKGVQLIGEVADVNPYLQEASCFVTAFKRSAGIKGKVLEAMATGTPVVSTRRGSFGIEAVAGKEILIADTPKEFAQSVIGILTNEKLYKEIARNARKLVEQSYDWDKITMHLDSLYQQIMLDTDINDNVTTIVPKSESKAISVKDSIALDKIVERIDKIIGISLKQVDAQDNCLPNANPEELHIELTHSCNSRCITCDIWDYHKRNNKTANDELSFEEIKSLVSNSGCLKDIKTVVLSGGEPFLRKDIVQICRVIIEALPRASIGILTNGLDTENIISKTKNILAMYKPNNLWIGSSLDGIGEGYDKIRGTKGGFEHFLNSVECFKKELPHIKLSLTFVLTPLNIDNLIPCWEFANKNGLDFFAQFGVPKQARDTEVFNWQEDELVKTEDYVLQIIQKLISGNAKLPDFYNSLSVVSDKINLLTKIYYWAHLVDFQRSGKRFLYKCDAASKFAMFDPYGNLFFCPLLKEKTAGNIRKENFDELWRSKEAEEIRSFIATGSCSCWLVCTVFPIVNKALSLFGDEVASAKKNESQGIKLDNAEPIENKIIVRIAPKGVTIGTNYKCNADCMFCLGGEYKPFSLRLYKDYFEPRLSEILKKTEFVSFCGMGELLLTPDAQEFLDYINKNLARQNKILTTNGLTFKPALLDRFTETAYSIQVSLHASNQALHTQLTGVKGGFETIIKDIKYLVSRRKNKQSPYIVLVFLINTVNIEDLPSFVELASSLGVDMVQCSYLTVFKSSHIKLSCFFKQELTNEMFDKARYKAEELNMPLILPPRFQDNGKTYFRAVCNEAWNNIYVDTEGAVLPCCYSGEHFGELKDADILSIWNNEKYQQLRRGLISRNNEGMCKYCLNNNPDNVNLLNSHVSFRPEVQKEIFR